MVEEGILKNIIESNDLINADLFIAVSTNSYKFGIAKSRNNLSILEEINISPQTNIWDQLSISPIDLNKCQDINIVTHSEVYTLVPAALYDEDHKIDYLLQLTNIENNVPVISDFIKEIDSYLIYQPSFKVLSLLNESPFLTRIHHHAAIMIKYEFTRVRSFQAHVYIHFENNCFNCVVIKNRQLIYSNSQKFVTASDAIYYILSIYQHNQLDPEEVELLISGKIMPYSELHNTLLRFIQKVEWFRTPPEVIMGSSGISRSDHLFADLIRLSLCV